MSVRKLLSKANPDFIKKPRAFISKQKQEIVVYLRYRSLEDFSQPRISIAHISKTLNMPFTTIQTILKRFESNGYKIVNRKN